MDEDNIGNIQDEEPEVMDALSLSDFPITSNGDEADHDDDDLSDYNVRRTSSDPGDFFEFFNHLSSEMSHAEDIFFCGKLAPFKDQPLSDDQPHKKDDHDKVKTSYHRRRSESLSELTSSQSSTTTTAKTPLMRTSRSLDYQKLGRTFSIKSQASEIHRNSSLKSSGRSENSGHKVLKPRWYLFMLGLAKFPVEMELKDMKNRQVRRTPATMFPTIDGEKNFPVNRSQQRKSTSWGLLRVLSCKGPASVAVTAPFGCMPQV